MDSSILLVNLISLNLLFPNMSVKEVRKDYLSKVGKSLVCESPKYDNTMLDIYEAKEQNNLKLSIPKQKGKTAFQLAYKVFDKLKPIHPQRAKYYKAVLNYYLRLNWKENRDVELGGSPADTALAPSSCIQKTILSFHLNETRKHLDVKFLVDKTLFEKMDIENQVALIVHSAIAYEAITNLQVEDPYNVRLFTSLLLSENIEHMSRTEFINFLKHIRFHSHLDGKSPFPSPEDFHLYN